jgi:hypothetical protein
MIAKARGDIGGARTHLLNVRNNNPHFSVLHTVEVESALRALEGKN